MDVSAIFGEQDSLNKLQKQALRVLGDECKYVLKHPILTPAIMAPNTGLGFCGVTSQDMWYEDEELTWSPTPKFKWSKRLLLAPIS